MPRAYIFDLDGTCANIDHRLPLIVPPKYGFVETKPGSAVVVEQEFKPDWDKFYLACPADTPIAPICHLAHSLMQREFVLFVTGRDDMVQRETLNWLRQFVAPPALLAARSKLYMRKHGDHRADHIIKLEMLDAIRADGFDPIMAFDDRNAVVKAWREAGIVCAQVADGNF